MSDGSIEIGQRLRAERKRLGLTQEDMGHEAGVTGVSQRNYESGRRVPDAAYLAAIAGVGADVGYVITGRPSSALAAADESELLRLYRAAPQTLREAAIRVLGGTPVNTVAAAPSAVQGDVGQVVQGNLRTRSQTFHVGGKGTGKRGRRK